MSNLCVIRDCPGSIRRKKRGEKIYFFRALEDQLEEWNLVIPAGNNKIKINDRICSRHFRDDDLIKEWNFVINDKTVTMPRGRWTLRIGAVPEKFDNYEDDFTRQRRGRKSRPTSLVEPAGSSSSDEEYEEPHRKRPKKMVETGSPKVTKTYAKSAPKTPETGSKSGSKSTEKTSKETNGKLSDQEVDWEKSCDNFVSQLNTICPPAPTGILNATPAKRGRGRPRKNPVVPVIKRGRGRPRKDQQSVWVSRTPTSHKLSTRSKRRKSFSSETSELETENSVTVEQFVASGSEESDFESSDAPQSSSESDAKPAQRGRGRPPKKKRPVLVSRTDLEQAASGSEGDVEILNDPVSSSDISVEFQIPSQITIKTEECDKGYENCDSASSKHLEHCSVTSTSEDSTLRQGPENKWNYEGTVVKREMCECEGSDSECCEPVKNRGRILELPTSPISCVEIDVEESQIDHEGLCTAHEPPTSGLSTVDVNFEPIQTSHSDRSEQEPSDRGVMSESVTDFTEHASQSGESLIRTPTSGIDREKLTALGKTGETNVHGLPRSSKNYQHIKESSNLKMGFQGFSSDEDENLVLKRGVFKDSKGMAVRSTMFYFSKRTEVCKPANNKPPVECEELSPSTSLRGRRERRSSVEIAIDQLNDLKASDSVRSGKSSNRKKQALVTNSAPNVQGGKFKEKLVHDFRCDEVLKCGRISDEVTVTKASNPSQRLDKVAPISNLSQELDKVTPSRHLQFAEKSSLKSHSLIQSSKSELILNKVTTSSHCDVVKDRTMAKSSNRCQNNHEVMSSKSQLFKDKVAVSPNRDLFKDVGTSTTEIGSLKDKIPSTYNHPPVTVPDRLGHQLNGSSLDRILQSTKGHPLLDSVSSTSVCDLTADKTSLILKNFKSDGVLALECVVYKEQVRQLQKELFRHKQMLIESEHNVALLQRRLELEAELPCAKCLNLRRGFIGKETLI